MIRWSRTEGYECSSRGDIRFSAFDATMPDGRTIEQWYQCDIKGFDPGGTNWRHGKGKEPILFYPNDDLWMAYLTLWRVWAVHNSVLVEELYDLAVANGSCLRDRFATHKINQANALATILNQWIIGATIR